VDKIDIDVFTIYPNPTKGNFRINKSVEKVEIYDLLGRKVKSFTGNFSADKSYDVSTLKSSIYIIKIKSNLGNSSQRLVIE
ncbi:MAG: T9SS type A sorting domain-containing protein, partial [Flavobacteriaceae bacterium]|nr:T9SS type A sorting domain-containing protein [Flavobacteriaceae bacterium]